MKVMAEAGRWTGGKAPYGYKYRDVDQVHVTEQRGRRRRRVVRGIEPCENEVRAVRLIFDLYVNENLGMLQLLRRINNPPHSLRKRNGRPWDVGGLAQVLKNPVYIGRPAWRKTTYRDGRQRPVKPQEWVYCDQVVPELRIVDDELWRRAQELRAQRAAGMPSPGNTRAPGKVFVKSFTTSHLLLSGRAFCAACVEPLVGKVFTRPSKTRAGAPRYRREGYTCRNKRNGATSCCPGRRGFWAKDMLESLVLTVIRQFFADITPERVERQLREQRDRELSSAREAQGAIRQRLRALQATQDYYLAEFNRLLQGERTELPREVISRQLNQLQEQISSLEQSQAGLESRLQSAESEIADVDRIGWIVEHWEEAFEAAPAGQKKELVAAVVKKVTAGETEVVIELVVHPDVLKCSADGASTLSGRSVSFRRERRAADLRVPG